MTTLDGTPLSRLGLGCSRIGSFNNATPMPVIRATLALALDSGINVLDTADIYGQGDSEREIGRLLRHRRDQAFVVTKFGKRFSRRMRLLRPLKPLLSPILGSRGRRTVTAKRVKSMDEDFTPARFVRALEASLYRLRFDVVDGVLLHSPPASALADGQAAHVLQELVASGKARAYGVSCDDRACLEAALAMPGLKLLQLPFDIIVAMGAELREVQQRGIVIFAREVIKLQPELAPPEAVASASCMEGITCVLAGISDPTRLRDIIGAIERRACDQ